MEEDRLEEASRKAEQEEEKIMSLRRFIRKERHAAALKPLLFEGRPAFIPLTSPLTSTSWDGDQFSTTAKTLIDLSSAFGAPAGMKAVLVFISMRDSGSGTNPAWLCLSPNSTANEGPALSVAPYNDRWTDGVLIVPCDANGDIYYQCLATGASTLDIALQIWGYWI